MSSYLRGNFYTLRLATVFAAKLIAFTGSFVAAFLFVISFFSIHNRRGKLCEAIQQCVLDILNCEEQITNTLSTKSVAFLSPLECQRRLNVVNSFLGFLRS